MIKKLMLFTSIIWLILSTTNIIYGSEESITISAVIIHRKNAIIGDQWEFYSQGYGLKGNLDIIDNQILMFKDSSLKSDTQVIMVKDISGANINYINQDTLSLKVESRYTGTPHDALIKKEIEKNYIGHATSSKHIDFKDQNCKKIVLKAKNDFTVAQIFLATEHTRVASTYSLYEIDFKTSFVPKIENTLFNSKYIGITFGILAFIIAAYCFIKMR